MSLESQVAAFVAAAAQHQALLPQFLAAAQAQIAAVTSTYNDAIGRADIQRYVDRAAGSDTNNNGQSAGAPYRTLSRAIADGVPGGLVTIILAGSGYYMDEHVPIVNRTVRILPPLGQTAKPVFTFAQYADGVSGRRCLKRFTLVGSATLTLLNCSLKMPNRTGYEGLVADWRACMISPPDGLADSIFVRSGIGLLNCDLDLPAANFGSVIGGTLYQLYAYNCSALNAPILGRLLEGYTNLSGTSVSSLYDVFTNLASV